MVLRGSRDWLHSLLGVDAFADLSGPHPPAFHRVGPSLVLILLVQTLQTCGHVPIRIYICENTCVFPLYNRHE